MPRFLHTMPGITRPPRGLDGPLFRDAVRANLGRVGERVGGADVAHDRSKHLWICWGFFLAFNF